MITGPVDMTSIGNLARGLAHRVPYLYSLQLLQFNGGDNGSPKVLCQKPFRIQRHRLQSEH